MIREGWEKEIGFRAHHIKEAFVLSSQDYEQIVQSYGIKRASDSVSLSGSFLFNTFFLQTPKKQDPVFVKMFVKVLKTDFLGRWYDFWNISPGCEKSVFTSFHLM